MKRAFLLAPLLLGGCISLLPKPPPPPQTFVLEAHNVEPANGPPVDAVIAVAQPTGERSILGADVIWRNGDQIAFVDQMQWSNRAELSLQSMLVETLTRQGRFTAATPTGEARAEYEIRWNVLDFEVREDTMQARFSADVNLVQSPGRRIIAHETVMAEAPVEGRSQTQAAQALARAAREGSARIGMFAADAAAQAEAQAAETSRR
ncbi:MAG TPA: ABC-type transport auxiliary lipoprotein family protein [Candidatus Binatia bacterium]|nr:ABC-type transport auxiliary lipoprotein family protein [Candidatus Binatia bacterium]